MPVRGERRLRLALTRWQDLPRTKPPRTIKKHLGDLVGSIDDKSTREMLAAIEETCERVEEDPA